MMLEELERRNYQRVPKSCSLSSCDAKLFEHICEDESQEVFTVTRLRKMMLEELERSNYSESSSRRYLSFVERFSQHFGKSPDKLGPDHLRTYQAYLLKVKKLDPGTVEEPCVCAAVLVHTHARSA